jgi:hypothetical protein
VSQPTWCFRLVCAGVLVLAPASAGAFEVSGGVSVGGIQVGTEPRLAVSGFAGLHWRIEGSFLLKGHTMFSILPGPRVGFYDRTAAALGYAWKTVNVGLGPSLSIYSMPVCGVVICNHVAGIAPGGHAEAEWFFSDPLGVSVSANVDWAGGGSRVLPGGLVMMVTAGPVLRLQTRSK